MSTYSIIRLIVVVSAVILIFTVSVKFKKKVLAIFCGFAILITAIAVDLCFPIENNFINFNTIQKAFSYSNKGEIVNVLEGKNSGLVVYKDNGTLGLCFLPKTAENEWKLDSAFSSEIFYSKYTKAQKADCNIIVYKIKQTNDFYIAIDIFCVDEVPIISDNFKSDFICIVRDASNKIENSYSFYTFVDSLKNNYEIYIFNESIQIYTN